MDTLKFPLDSGGGLSRGVVGGGGVILLLSLDEPY